MQNIGDKIYSLRKKRRLSQEELGYEIGVSRQTISKWESNSVQPNLENIKTLCAILQVTPEYFINDSVDQEVAADNVDVITQNIPTEITNNYNNKKTKTLLLSSGIVLSILNVVAIAFCIVVGLTAFTSNTGDDVVSSFKYDSWSFIICLVVTVILVTLNIFTWIKFVKIKKQQM